MIVVKIISLDSPFRGMEKREEKIGAPDNPIHAPIEAFPHLRNISVNLLVVDSTMLRLHNT